MAARKTATKKTVKRVDKPKPVVTSTPLPDESVATDTDELATGGTVVSGAVVAGETGPINIVLPPEPEPEPTPIQTGTVEITRTSPNAIWCPFCDSTSPPLSTRCGNCGAHFIDGQATR